MNTTATTIIPYHKDLWGDVVSVWERSAYFEAVMLAPPQGWGLPSLHREGRDYMFTMECAITARHPATTSVQQDDATP